MKKILGTTLLAAAAAIVLGSSTACTNPSTPAGHEGYVYEDPRLVGNGGFQGVVVGPGNYGVSLRRNQVVNIDVRPATYNETFQIMTQDELNVSFDFHSVIAVRSGTVREVVETYGAAEWYTRYLQKPLRTFVRETVQPYNSTEIKAHRVDISKAVQQRLDVYLQETPFEVISVVVGNIDYPKVVADAVEKKLAAQQLLQEKETQKAIMMKDAEIRIEEARGIAEAQKIINATLTPAYLQHEAIQAQLKMADSPNHTTVYIPVGTNGVPLVQNLDGNR